MNTSLFWLKTAKPIKNDPQSKLKNFLTKQNIRITRVFYKQDFYKQRQAEISKNQTKAKQHPKAENYSSSLSTLSS